MVNRKRIYQILEDPSEGDNTRKVFEVFISAVIMANIFFLILDTVEDYHRWWGHYFFLFNILAVSIFTVGYFLRLWSCTESEQYNASMYGRLLYMSTPLAFIDLLAIIPFYLAFLNLSGLNLTFLRIIRLVRMAKLSRYSQSIQVVINVVRSRRDQLAAIVFIFFLVLIMASSMMYYAEHEAQPDKFSSIPESMWWAVITLTTVGYGDVAPITPLGKIIGGFIALLGVLFLALPTAVLGAGFVEEMEKRFIKQIEEKSREKTKCPKCGHKFHK